jgi:hypothetical protein
MAAAPAPELASHGYVITKPVRGSDIPMDLTFVLTRDEIYVPIAVRKPPGDGPFPAITMARGNGRGGMPFVEAQVERLASLQDRIIQRGYVVATVNYRNEIPLAYENAGRARNLSDSMTTEGRTLKSDPSLDSDDLIAAFDYLKTLPYVNRNAIGAVGVSHSGEAILKAAAETGFAAGVAIEGASHEFLSVDTGPGVPAGTGRSSTRTSSWPERMPTRRGRWSASGASTRRYCTSAATTTTCRASSSSRTNGCGRRARIRRG